MGFHSAMSAACNKNMGYGSDDGAITHKRKGYRSVLSERIAVNKVVAAVWFT